MSSISTAPSVGGGTSSAVGHRFAARAVVEVWTVTPALRRRYARNAVVVVFPAVPVTPTVGTAARSSTQVGQAPDDRAPLAQERDPRRDLRRPDVEEGLVVRARIAVEACACAHD